MTRKAATHPPVRHYFVDEAGDPILFARKGRVVVGTNGCSRFFMIGCLDVPEPRALHDDLEALRKSLMADPLLKGAPSMQPETEKTAAAFHAKDDLPEVRHQVFQTLLKHPLKFYAVVRDKKALLNFVRIENEKKPDYRYSENEVYDALVARLFRDRLHKADAHAVTFARRGSRDRTAALRHALDRAKQAFFKKWGRAHHGPVGVSTSSPAHSAGLQAADYFLWALQRVFERGEDRFIAALWSKVRLVVDMDDTRKAGYGVYYDQRKPVTARAIRRDGEGEGDGTKN